VPGNSSSRSVVPDDKLQEQAAPNNMLNKASSLFLRHLTILLLPHSFDQIGSPGDMSIGPGGVGFAHHPNQPIFSIPRIGPSSIDSENFRLHNE